jgi:selenocysteine lyase/cysteine desulfurase
MAVLCPARSSTLHHIAMDQRRLKARTEVARLIHADETEVALVESTSHGLNIIGIPASLWRVNWKRTDQISADQSVDSGAFS